VSARANVPEPQATEAAGSREQTYLMLAALVLLWGCNWPIIKVGLAYIPPLWFGLTRMCLGSLCLFAALAVTRRLAFPTRADLPILLSVGTFQMVGHLALMNFGLLYVEAGRSAILGYTIPLWVTPGAILFLGERVTRLKLLGLACGFLGLATLFNPAGFDWSDRDVVIGNGLLLVAALSWSVAILHVRGHVWHRSPLQLAPWQMLVAVPALLALALVFEGDAEFRWSPELAAILVYNGPIATAFCYWAAVTLTRRLPAITTSISLLAVPVVGVIASTIALGEALTPTLLTGFGLILAGLVIVNLADRRR
jgi:drug/metabolite transporter (DMT)-like permease